MLTLENSKFLLTVKIDEENHAYKFRYAMKNYVENQQAHKE